MGIHIPNLELKKKAGRFRGSIEGARESIDELAVSNVSPVVLGAFQEPLYPIYLE